MNNYKFKDTIIRSGRIATNLMGQAFVAKEKIYKFMKIQFN